MLKKQKLKKKNIFWKTETEETLTKGHNTLHFDVHQWERRKLYASWQIWLPQQTSSDLIHSQFEQGLTNLTL